MEKKLKALIGRNVRLKYRTFERLVGSAKESDALENLFVVAAIARGMNKLVCYGSNIRVVVSLSDVVLI
ncbi:MAG: hypothetical protein IPI89_05740 [Propionivibrio sp.]|nr:hypothetical protein [Propionivibrio sp.]